jgi:hypothetical protein
MDDWRMEQKLCSIYNLTTADISMTNFSELTRLTLLLRGVRGTADRIVPQVGFHFNCIRMTVFQILIHFELPKCIFKHETRRVM